MVNQNLESADFLFELSYAHTEPTPTPRVKSIMNPALIINPSAGRGISSRVVKQLAEVTASWPEPPDLIYTAGPGDGMTVAAQLRQRGCPLVVACGGDGTVHEVVNGLFLSESSSPLPLFSFIPLGTGCDTARSLHLPNNPYTILRQLPAGRVVPIDVGKITFQTSSKRERNRYFINDINVGLGPLVAKRAKHPLLSWMGGSAYTIGTAIELLKPLYFPLKLQVDDQPWQDFDTFNLSICNGHYFGGGMKPCSEAGLTSGKLEALHIGPITTLEGFRYMKPIMSGREVNHPAIRIFSFSSLQIEGAEVEFETDGEIPGNTPMKITLIPRALRVNIG